MLWDLIANVPLELIVAAGVLVFMFSFGRWLWMTPEEGEAIKKAARLEAAAETEKRRLGL